jgi:hypothetical protein
MQSSLSKPAVSVYREDHRGSLKENLEPKTLQLWKRSSMGQNLRLKENRQLDGEKYGLRVLERRFAQAGSTSLLFS